MPISLTVNIHQTQSSVEVKFYKAMVFPNPASSALCAFGLALTAAATANAPVEAATVRHIDSIKGAKDRALQGFSCTSPPAAPRAWSCPASLCPSGGCTDAVTSGKNAGSGGTWKDWLLAHNTWRCLHDLPGVSWNNADFEKAWPHFEPATTMVHSPNAFRSDSQGENLFWSSCMSSDPDYCKKPENIPEPDAMTKAWYDEIVDCHPSTDGGKTYPDGCKEPKDPSKMVGHFTALIWKGVSEIACAQNNKRVAWCWYRPGPYVDDPDTTGVDESGETAICNIPNMIFNGDADITYRHNVLPPATSRTLDQCKALAAACGGGSDGPAGSGGSGSGSNSASSAAPATGGATVFGRVASALAVVNLALTILYVNEKSLLTLKY